MTETEPGELGDGPSSHETSGEFPADDVGLEVDAGPDVPSSHETSGQFPADDVAGGTAASSSTEPDPTPPPADQTSPAA